MKSHSSRAKDRRAFNARGWIVEEPCFYGRWCDDLARAAAFDLARNTPTAQGFIVRNPRGRIVATFPKGV